MWASGWERSTKDAGCQGLPIFLGTLFLPENLKPETANSPLAVQAEKLAKGTLGEVLLHLIGGVHEGGEGRIAGPGGEMG